jgi:integrase
LPEPGEITVLSETAARTAKAEGKDVRRIEITSKKHERQRIPRDDFYDRDETDRLLLARTSVHEEVFWLLGADGDFRLPGEALGLRKGAVDFQANVIRVHHNWVRNAPRHDQDLGLRGNPDDPRLARTLAKVLDRDNGDGPVSQRSMRKAFKFVQQQAGLEPIKMYNLRHSSGTTLAQRGVVVRTIQALMRHERITMTEQYMAYRPQP